VCGKATSTFSSLPVLPREPPWAVCLLIQWVGDGKHQHRKANILQNPKLFDINRTFIGQVPICVAAFVAVYYVLDLPKTDHAHWMEKIARIDFLGAFCLVIAVTSLMVGLDSGSNEGWTNVVTITGLSLAPAFFAIFIFVEMKVASHPFAPGHVIFDPSLFAAYLANFFGVAGQIAAIFFMPLYFQAVMGYSATQSGTLLIPPMICAVAASITGGLVIKRTGRYYWFTIFSFGVLMASIIPLTVFTYLKYTPGVEIGIMMTTAGFGSGKKSLRTSKVKHFYLPLRNQAMLTVVHRCHDHPG
jgi:hypothetical protein